MAIYWICLVAILGVTLADDSCPEDLDFKRSCYCDYEGVNCMDANTLDDIKKAFSVKFKYGATRGLWIQGTPITSLPADLFGEIEIQKVYIEDNAIETVDLKAFKASKIYLTELSLYANKITDFPYSGLAEFKNLGTLNLGRNKISSIPEDAFHSETLWRLILSENDIKHIGPNAFANLPSLRRLDLIVNKLTELEPMSLASKKHGDRLMVNLAGNQISKVASDAFQGLEPFALLFNQNELTSLKKDPFEALITKIAQIGGIIQLYANPLSCSGCDYSWIALNKEMLAKKLDGFTCKDGRSVLDLTKENIGCI